MTRAGMCIKYIMNLIMNAYADLVKTFQIHNNFPASFLQANTECEINITP